LKINVYAVCWNEEQRLPYFLRHNETFANRIIIYDNMSTDRSQEIIKSHPKAELRTYDTEGKIRDDVYLFIKNNVWKHDEYADWVIVGDVDELIYNKNIIQRLREIQEGGYTVVEPKAYKFFRKEFPDTEGQIYEQVYMGKECATKLCIFKPNELEEIGFTPGCHSAFPKGNVNVYTADDIFFLHFNFIGKEFIAKRRIEYSKRLSPQNMEHGWGLHYLDADKGNEQRFIDMANDPLYKDMRGIIF